MGHGKGRSLETIAATEQVVRTNKITPLSKNKLIKKKQYRQKNFGYFRTDSAKFEIQAVVIFQSLQMPLFTKCQLGTKDKREYGTC